MLAGMAFTGSQANHRLRVGVPATNRVGVCNLTTAALSGVSATAVGVPANVQVTVDVPSDLAGSATNGLTYTVTATSGTPAQGQFTLRLTSAEGASAELAVSVQIVPPVPQLVASPASLQRAMLRGGQTLVEVELANVGGAPANDIRVMIPPTSWLALGSTARIASLGMDETHVVTLVLTPAADLPFGP